MKRKYPISDFIFGVFLNFIRYSLILLLGVAVLLIGFLGVPFFKIVGGIIISFYIAYCIIVQINIREASLQESDNPDMNELMDIFYGVDESGEKITRSERNEKFKQFLEKKMKEQEEYDSLHPENEDESEETDEDDENID